MRFVIVIPPASIFLNELYHALGERKGSILEVKLGSKVVKLALCNAFSPYPAGEILGQVEGVRMEEKASGILCVSGENRIPELLTESLNRGYEVFLFYPHRSYPFLYGSSIVQRYLYRSFEDLLSKLDGALS